MRYFQLCNIFVENFVFIGMTISTNMRRTLFFALCFAAAATTPGVAQTRENSPFDATQGVGIFGSVLKELNTFYVDTIDMSAILEEGINAMLYTLDPYTVYIPETESDDFKFMTSGE